MVVVSSDDVRIQLPARGVCPTHFRHRVWDILLAYLECGLAW
jgi:hypothetical protein